VGGQMETGRAGRLSPSLFVRIAAVQATEPGKQGLAVGHLSLIASNSRLIGSGGRLVAGEGWIGRWHTLPAIGLPRSEPLSHFVFHQCAFPGIASWTGGCRPVVAPQVNGVAAGRFVGPRVASKRKELVKRM
jgi:hypothetical protein